MAPGVAVAPCALAAQRPRGFVAGERYRAALASRSEAERRQLARLKRLLERHDADPRFRAALAEPAADRSAVAEAYGIEVDPDEAAPLLRERNEPLSPGECDGSPLLRLWHGYRRDLDELRAGLLAAGDCKEVNPDFAAWRKRQIRRIRGEIGALANHISHPVFAFELSVGCSLGCWFCGVSAPRHTANFGYTPRNAALWRACLDQLVTRFGAAAQTGFCYWATDPSDNPDYPNFLEDFYRVIGVLPQTTTAAPLKDIGLTRRVLRLHDECGAMPNRFSILTLKMLDRVHAAFTADELLGVELVLQNPGAPDLRASAGRARSRPDRPGRREQDGAGRNTAGTIACVSGFLVNMVEGTIRLVSPTRASERWPLGYRIFGERRFTTAREFGLGIDELIDQHMPASIGAGQWLRFRDDLVYRRDADGFVLESKGARFALNGFAGVGALGELLYKGGAAGDIQLAAIGAGLDIFAVADILQQLFERGLFDEPQ